MFIELLIPAWIGLTPPIQRPSPVSVRWQAPPACPEVSSLREQIEGMAPGVLDDPTLESAQIDARVSAAEAGFEVTIEIRTSEGHSRRQLASPDCATLARASALLIAVVLDPLRSAANLSPVRPPSSAPEVELVPPPAEPSPGEAPLTEPPPTELGPTEPGASPSEAPPEPEASQRGEPSLTTATSRGRSSPAAPRFGLRLDGGGGYGPTTTGYGGIGGMIAVFGPRWRAELGASWTITREIREPDGAGGLFDAWAIAPRGCFVATRARFEFPSCAGIELGQVRGRGLPSLPVTLEANFPWVAPNLGQGFYFAPVESLAFGIELDLAVPLSRGSFSVSGDAVQTIAPVRARALVGVEIRI